MTPRARAALLLVGALLGGAAGPWLADRVATPTALDPAVWTVVTADRGDALAETGPTRGTRQVGATMLLTPHAFGRVDVVSPRDTRPTARIEVALASGSADLPLQVRIPGGGIVPVAQLGPEGWRTAPHAALRPYTHPGPAVVEIRDGRAWVDGVGVGRAAPGTVELHPDDGPTTITTLRLYDEAGALFLSFGGEAFPATPTSRVGGAIAGALATALLALAVGRGSRAAALVTALGVAIPPALVLTVPYPGWVAAVERLYLAQVEPAALRTLALAAALLPLVGAALLGSGILVPGRRRRGWLPGVVTGGIGVAVTVAASRNLAGVELLAALPGLAFVLFPAWTARRVGDPAAWTILRDLPALLALATLGWGPGLLLAVLWRGACLLADAPRWVHDHARAGADAALVLLLASPLAVELAVRASPARRAWDPTATVAPTDPTVPPAPSWEDRCGGEPERTARPSAAFELATLSASGDGGGRVGAPGRPGADDNGASDAEKRRAEPGARDRIGDVIYALGGSSTGGAFQFANAPGAFWPGRLHARLCADGEAVRTVNLGGGDRTTWEMARFAPTLYAQAAPAVTIVYAGVNDLLGRNSPLTRREAAERAAAVEAPIGILGVSRLLFGLSLALRPPPDDGENVQAVPLADAEANLRELAAATTGAGGRLLLVTEYTRGGGEAEMRPYWEMERRLAAEVPGVRFLDLYAPLADVPVRDVLADANHHTRDGAVRVAGLIAPEVRALLAERR